MHTPRNYLQYFTAVALPTLNNSQQPLSHAPRDVVHLLVHAITFPGGSLEFCLSGSFVEVLVLIFLIFFYFSPFYWRKVVPARGRCWWMMMMTLNQKVWMELTYGMCMLFNSNEIEIRWKFGIVSFINTCVDFLFWQQSKIKKKNELCFSDDHL